jgi:hypothetical protein
MLTPQVVDAQHGGALVSRQLTKLRPLFPVEERSTPTRFTRSSCSSPAENEQRATTQTPQGLDAQHGGALTLLQVIY